MIAPALRRTVVRVDGADRTTFLNRMLTQQLDPESAAGAYGYLLEANGQLVSGGYWLHRSDAWWALTSADLAAALAEGLQKYVFFRDAVAITVLPEQQVRLKPDPQGTYLDTGSRTTIVDWTDLTDATVPDDPEPDFRRRAGVPILGIEVQPGDLVLEWDLGLGLAQKGCYVGQEVIERMWSRARRARGRVVVESREPMTDGHSYDDPQFGTLQVRAPIRDPHTGLWLALGLCKAVPAPDQPWQTSQGLTIHHPPLSSDLPPSLGMSYDRWAMLR